MPQDEEPVSSAAATVVDLQKQLRSQNYLTAVALQLRTENCGLQNEISALKRDVEGLQAENSGLNEVISALKRDLEQKNVELSAEAELLRRVISERERTIAGLRARSAYMQESWSWRLTSPLRYLLRAVRNGK